jgi:hypothetical protein
MNYEEIEVESMGVLKTHIVIDLGNGAYKTFAAEENSPEYIAFLKQLEEQQ